MKYSGRTFSAFLILIPIMVFILAACGKTSSNDLLQNAVTTDGLSLYIYNDEECYCLLTGDSNTIREILDELKTVEVSEAGDWSVDDVAPPVYGITIDATDGTTISAAWCNGYWITESGTVYSYDYDFAGLEQDYRWTDRQEISSLSDFPCRRLLTRDENKWNNTLLTPAPVLNPPDGIKMTIEWHDQDSNIITAIFKNGSGSYWEYDEFYNFYVLHVLLDDNWYVAPYSNPLETRTVNAIAYGVSDGGEFSKDYNLTSMYGNLPAGTYHLVVEQLSAEFVVT